MESQCSSELQLQLAEEETSTRPGLRARLSLAHQTQRQTAHETPQALRFVGLCSPHKPAMRHNCCFANVAWHALSCCTATISNMSVYKHRCNFDVTATSINMPIHKHRRKPRSTDVWHTVLAELHMAHTHTHTHTHTSRDSQKRKYAYMPRPKGSKQSAKNFKTPE